MYLNMKALSRNMCKNFIYKKLLVKTRSLEGIVSLYLNFIIDFLYLIFLSKSFNKGVTYSGFGNLGPKMTSPI